MADIKSQSTVKIEGKIFLILSEEEARALDAIVGYGPERFVEWFYKNLGKSYLKPHEEGMRSLFETCRGQIDKHLHRFDKARAALTEHIDK